MCDRSGIALLPETMQGLAEALQVYDCPGLSKARYGQLRDGGYVLLRELMENRVYCLYSYGIGDDMSFELDVLDRHPEARACLFDPTIDSPPVEHPRARFFKKPLTPMCLLPDSIMKVDVEGDEWQELLHWPEKELERLDQLVIELHFVHAIPPTGLTPYFTEFYRRHYRKINQRLFCRYLSVLNIINRNFRLFHLHANNSLPPIQIGGRKMFPLLEASYVNRSLVPDAVLSWGSLPVEGLDYPNKTDRPDCACMRPPEKLC